MARSSHCSGAAHDGCTQRRTRPSPTALPVAISVLWTPPTVATPRAAAGSSMLFRARTRRSLSRGLECCSSIVFDAVLCVSRAGCGVKCTTIPPVDGVVARTHDVVCAGVAAGDPRFKMRRSCRVVSCRVVRRAGLAGGAASERGQSKFRTTATVSRRKCKNCTPPTSKHTAESVDPSATSPSWQNQTQATKGCSVLDS